MSVEVEQVTWDAAQVSARIFGDDSRAHFVQRRMSTGQWPHRKIGTSRRMTDADIQAALDIEYQPPTPKPEPPASGLSPRSRRRTH